MNCQELTTFLQKVLDNRGLIFEPKDEELEEAFALKEEIERAAEDESLYNQNIRSRVKLSQELNLSYVGDFYDDWAVAIRKESKRTVFVDKYGNFFKGPDDEVLEFEEADRFSGGIAAVLVISDDPAKIRFLKKDGTFLNGFYCQSQDSDLSRHRFSLGFALGSEDNKSIYVKSDGTTIDIGGNYETANPPSDGAWALMKERTGLYEFHSFLGKGRLMTEFGNDTFDDAAQFSEGFAPIKINDDWIFINTEGKFCRRKEDNTIVQIHRSFWNPQRIAKIESRHNGWFRFTAGALYGFVKEDGSFFQDEAGSRRFVWTSNFSEGFAIIRFNVGDHAIFRYIDIAGKYLRDEDGKMLEFTHAQNFNEGLALVQQTAGAEAVWMDRQGRIIEFGKNISDKLNA